MLEHRAVQAPQRNELRGRADAIVERPARGPGPREADVLLRHGYRLPGADAPGHGFGARSGAHVDAERGRGVTREARVTRQEDARDVTLVRVRSEEHTSELQSPCNLVCRLLLEKKKKTSDDLSDNHIRAPRH